MSDWRRRYYSKSLRSWVVMVKTLRFWVHDTGLCDRRYDAVRKALTYINSGSIARIERLPRSRWKNSWQAVRVR